jgi:proteasome lid subunit RPN8/RPN11
MRNQTRRAMPTESLGVLVGQHYEDQHGGYTVVSGAQYSDNTDASAGHVRASAEEMSQLKARALQRNPTSSIVGWTHSHNTMAQYSNTDVDEQSTWCHNYQVGILTLMSGPEWGVAYRGPDAKPLGFPMPSRSIPPRASGEQRPAFVAHEHVTASNDERRGRTSPPRTPPSQPLPTVVMPQRSPGRQPPTLMPVVLVAVATVVLAMQLAMLWRIDSSIDNLARRVSGIESSSTEDVVGNLEPVCRPLSGTAPLSVSCSVSHDAGRWDFGDGSTQNAGPISHTFEEAGTYTVAFASDDSGGESSEMTITVIAPAPGDVGPRQRCLISGAC